MPKLAYRLAIPHRALLASTLLLGTALATGCGPEPQVGSNCVGRFLPGDLVITEVMANPEGEDSGAEWFEIYNATSDSVDVSGLILKSAREDGTSEKVHEMDEAIIAPGGYLVVGNVLPEFAPPHVTYGYSNDLGDLRNTAGLLELRCDVVSVDQVIYGEMSSGKSRGLNGSIAPDYSANDDLANWCESTVEFTPGNFGSPGAENERCDVILPNMCDDNGNVRAVVPPEAGDLVITELIPNPEATSDTQGEWFEILATKDVDLNGLFVGRELGTAGAVISAPDCKHVSVGQYVVFAKNLDPATNGMLPKADFTFGFALVNGSTSSPGKLVVAHDGNLIDEITWTSSASGAARSLHPDRLTSTDNDISENWCTAVDPYGLGDKGTPGATNPACDLPVPAGQCMDVSGPRPIVKPTAGQIKITEYMPNPMAVGDTAGEWFEIQTTADIDLNELQLSNSATLSAKINNPNCLRITAGGYALFARSTDMLVNGGLPAVDATFSFGLTNSAGMLNVGIDGVSLDMVNWTTSTDGRATSLDPGGVTWCPAALTDIYGMGDKGTPRAANPACP